MGREKYINPFYIGERFIDYCIKNKWVVLEFAEDKRLHYWVTQDGERALLDLYGMQFDCPCALEGEEEKDDRS